MKAILSVLLAFALSGTVASLSAATKPGSNMPPPVIDGYKIFQDSLVTIRHRIDQKSLGLIALHATTDSSSIQVSLGDRPLLLNEAYVVKGNVIYFIDKTVYKAGDTIVIKHRRQVWPLKR